MFANSRLLPALLCLLLPLSAIAAPLSLNSIPQHRLPPAAIDAATQAGEDDPLRFAAAVTIDLGVADGRWDEPDSGTARWRLRLASTDALSLSLRLGKWSLPAGATLWLIGEDSGDVQGPLGADAEWLPLVRGAAATLEARMPAAAREHFGLQLATAFHGYRGLSQDSATTAKGHFGTSGSCNRDVACTDANPWLPQVRSAVLITRGNSALCSGTLINNTEQDETPYVLSANHCEYDDPESPVSSLRAYFNVQRGSCGNGANGPVTQNLGVEALVANNASSDFALLRLKAQENGRRVTDFNVYFAGWDVSGSAPASGATIHHPAGDDKKISLYSGGATQVNNVEITPTLIVDAWEVHWSSGTTQPGSSGAALWNQSGRVIGVLSGGRASCSSRSAPDYFGRLDLAWTGENKAAGSTLQPFLAPGDTTIRSFPALNRGVDPPPSMDEGSRDDRDSGGGAAPPLLLLMLAALAWRRRH